MDKNTLENYLNDLGTLIKEMAYKAKEQKDITFESEEYDYNLGYLMAIHEIISVMQQQAVAFDVPLDVIALQDVNPELELL